MSQEQHGPCVDPTAHTALHSTPAASLMWYGSVYRNAYVSCLQAWADYSLDAAVSATSAQTADRDVHVILSYACDMLGTCIWQPHELTQNPCCLFLMYILQPC